MEDVVGVVGVIVVRGVEIMVWGGFCSIICCWTVWVVGVIRWGVLVILVIVVDILIGNNIVDGGVILMEEVCFGNVGIDDIKIGRVLDVSLRGDKRVVVILVLDIEIGVVDRLVVSLGVLVVWIVVVVGFIIVVVSSIEVTLFKLVRDCVSICLVWMVEFLICRVFFEERVWEGIIMRVGVELVRVDSFVLVLIKMDEVGRIVSCFRGGISVEVRLVCGVEVTLVLVICVVVLDCGKVKSWSLLLGRRIICWFICIMKRI